MRDSTWKAIAAALALFNVALLVYLLWSMVFGPSPSPFVASGSGRADVDLLSAQVAALEQYRSDMLTSVWGSIAALTVSLVVVVAAGLVLNARASERERA